jgi:hypothetical protein
MLPTSSKLVCVSILAKEAYCSGPYIGKEEQDRFEYIVGIDC